MGEISALVATVLLLAGNAFFVGAEFALISARRDRLEALASQGKRHADTVIRAGENLSMMLAAAQLGITICSILLGRIAEPALAALLHTPFSLVGIPGGVLHPGALVLALGIVAIVHILFGEMIPKNIALAGPERSALWLVPAHLGWLRIARPIIAAYNFVANTSLRLLRITPKDELTASVSATEFAEMIAESRSEGLLDADEHRRLTQALGTGSRIVADVMVPLAQTRTVPLHGTGVTTVGDIEDAVAETGFSRYPVRAPSGYLMGYLHIKDVLDEVADPSVGPSHPIPSSDIRPLPTVLTGATLHEALALLRRTNSHLGRVIDIRGATIGIVALEDLVEEFVGTVRDTTHRTS